MTIEKTGVFFPSRLAAELRAAGVDVAGVTCTEDDEGNVVAVQIICADDVDEATIDATCAAHDPAEQIVTVEAVADPMVAALEQLPPDQPVTASGLLAILRPEARRDA